jgi:BMFP domain-containing protein YqiC
MSNESIKMLLSKLDLVTREEFEVQEAVLARTREKLEALEAKLAAMEGPGEHRNSEESGADGN